MSTEEILWNATYENESKDENTDYYNYKEEAEAERYYDTKNSLFERLGECLRPR